MLPSYVLLDLETTGGSASGDSITEIAAVRVDHGVEVARWSTLVNPGTSIPYFIQNLTGITNDMVVDAPRFKHVADHLLTLLDGSVLVAHNASFDHGFLRDEYARLGHDLRVPSLCTVRLSRKLYPQYKSHGLDAIMQRHGLQTEARHRAMGDVDMVLAWLAQASAEFGVEHLREVAQALVRPPLGVPVHLETQLDDLPQGPGVYLLYGDGTTPLSPPLFIGSAVNLRERVASHLQSAGKSAREQGIVNNTRRIDWQATAGEVGAILLAKKRILELKPTYGKSGKPQSVIDPRALHAWPYHGPVGLREHDEQSARSEVHVFSQWRHVTTLRDEAELEAFLAQTDDQGDDADQMEPEPTDAEPIDMDIYRLLVKRLLSPGRVQAQVLNLRARAGS